MRRIAGSIWERRDGLVSRMVLLPIRTRIFFIHLAFSIRVKSFRRFGHINWLLVFKGHRRSPRKLLSLLLATASRLLSRAQISKRDRARAFSTRGLNIRHLDLGPVDLVLRESVCFCCVFLTLSSLFGFGMVLLLQLELEFLGCLLELAHFLSLLRFLLHAQVVLDVLVRILGQSTLSVVIKTFAGRGSSAEAELLNHCVHVRA
jgi:hypothetical protein